MSQSKNLGDSQLEEWVASCTVIVFAARSVASTGEITQLNWHA